MGKFSSHFNFHIAHISQKQNLVANALSRWPMVNVISITHHHDLTNMIDEYVQDNDYAQIVAKLANDIPHDPYSLKDRFLLHGSRLCITKNIWEKVMYELHVRPYACHHGIQATTLCPLLLLLQCGYRFFYFIKRVFYIPHIFICSMHKVGHEIHT